MALVVLSSLPGPKLPGRHFFYPGFLMLSREQVREIAERVAQRPVTPELLAQRDAIEARARAGDLLGVAHLLRQGMRCGEDKSRALAAVVLKLYANKGE